MVGIQIALLRNLPTTNFYSSEKEHNRQWGKMKPTSECRSSYQKATKIVESKMHDNRENMQRYIDFQPIRQLTRKNKSCHSEESEI